MEIVIYDLPLVVGLFMLGLVGIRLAIEIGRNERKEQE